MDTNTLNARLSAVLDKHPHLRPRKNEWELYFRIEQGSHPVPWRWWDGFSADPLPDEAYAHALIGMAMLNALPVQHQLHRWESSNGFEWGIFLHRGYPKPDVQAGTWHKSATEALLAFWESRTPDADAKGGIR